METTITITKVTTMSAETLPAQQQIDMAVIALFRAWCSGRLSLAQFMIRLRKVRDHATEAGLIVKN